MPTAVPNGLRRVAARLTLDPAPDGELLARFLAHRDEAAFAVLVRRHAAMVFGTCRRVLGNAADADDAFQAAFVVLVRKAHSLTDRACVGNLLYGIAFHTALKAKAMAAKRLTREARAKLPESSPDQSELLQVLDEELARCRVSRAGGASAKLEGAVPARRGGVARHRGRHRRAGSRPRRMLEKRLKSRGSRPSASPRCWLPRRPR